MFGPINSNEAAMSWINQTNPPHPPAGGWDTSPYSKEGKIIFFEPITFSSS
jgi:hypothetical protein